MASSLPLIGLKLAVAIRARRHCQFGCTTQTFLCHTTPGLLEEKSGSHKVVQHVGAGCGDGIKQEGLGRKQLKIFHPAANIWCNGCQRLDDALVDLDLCDY